MSEEKFYEIVDCTDDEIIHSMGFFKTLEEAKEQIINFPKDERISEALYDDEDYERMEIFERKFGWDYVCRGCHMAISREKYYDEIDDEYYWKVKDIYECSSTERS